MDQHRPLSRACPRWQLSPHPPRLNFRLPVLLLLLLLLWRLPRLPTLPLRPHPQPDP